jgi:hypothetical protein
MKKLILACMITFGAAAALQAQDTTATQNDRYQAPAQGNEDSYTDKDVVTEGDLPSQVQAALQSADYKDWTVSKAYKKMKDGQPMYAVELENGSEKKKVKFDAQGKVVKEKGKKKDMK